VVFVVPIWRSRQRDHENRPNKNQTTTNPSLLALLRGFAAQVGEADE